MIDDGFFHFECMLNSLHCFIFNIEIKLPHNILYANFIFNAHFRLHKQIKKSKLTLLMAQPAFLCFYFVIETLYGQSQHTLAIFELIANFRFLRTMETRTSSFRFRPSERIPFTIAHKTRS